MEDAERLNIRMPRELVDELKRLVPARKRSQLIVAATTEAVARLKQQEALREEKIWSDENHPDLATQEDINRYLAEIRASWEKRLRGRLSPGL
jgi:Arc/MetJ-type ribon-helix-helix transcriptional regulator